MAVSKRLRYEILRRDNHTCRYCGGAAPDVVLTEDAITISCGRDRVQLDQKFRYMCGIAWKQVEEMHHGARAFVEEEPEQQEAPEPGWESADYTAGARFVWGRLRFCDLPHELLAGHIDGREVYLTASMRWAA